MKTHEAEILVANTSAVFTHDGRKYRLVKGKTTARQGAKILRGREHLFEPLVLDLDDPAPAPADDQPKKRGRPPKAKVETKTEIA